MKPFYLFLLLVLTVSLSQAQIVNIPDANFKNQLLMYTSIDENGDGEIQVSEAESRTYLYLEHKQITDLTGIEYFIKLEGLECPSNLINTIDLSANTKLTLLNVHGNNLTALDVSNNTLLKYLYCGWNELTSLDVTKHVLLEQLGCAGNKLETLDLSKNSLLNWLDVSATFSKN